MAGNAINAKSDELTSEELDAVSGGWFALGCIAAWNSQQQIGGGLGNDEAERFAQILQQMTRE